MQSLVVGARVEDVRPLRAGQRRGILCVDNEDGSWNVDFDSGTEEDVLASWLRALLPEEVAEEMDGVIARGLHATASMSRRHTDSVDTSGDGILVSQGWIRRSRGKQREDFEYEEVQDVAALEELDRELRDGEQVASTRRSKLSCIFMLLLVGPTIGGLVLTLSEWFRPLITTVALGDAAGVEYIFSGGNKWLVTCVTARSSSRAPSRTLQNAAELLRARGIRSARVHCWEPLRTKIGQVNLAERFGFRNKPPVVMATSGSGKPVLLNSKGLSAARLANAAFEAIENATSPSHAGSAARSHTGLHDEGPRQKRSSNKARKDSVGPRPIEEDVEYWSSQEIVGQQHEEVVDLDL